MLAISWGFWEHDPRWDLLLSYSKPFKPNGGEENKSGALFRNITNSRYFIQRVLEIRQRWGQQIKKSKLVSDFLSQITPGPICLTTNHKTSCVLKRVHIKNDVGD